MAKKKTVPETLQPTRTLEEIMKEYTQLCTTSGELQYKIKIQEEDLLRLNQRIYQLNQEAAPLKAAALKSEADSKS
jgi:translation initiation factor IF-1